MDMNLLSFEIQENNASLLYEFKYSLIVQWHYRVAFYNRSGELEYKDNTKTLQNKYFEDKDLAIKAKNQLTMKAHTMGFAVMDKGETKK